MRNEIETKCNENILDVETLFEAIYEAMNTSREVEQSENAA